MGEEEHNKGVRYSDYFFLLAILFVFLIFFLLLCIGGIFATKWLYKRRTKEKLEEEREKRRREENAWKECEQKLREEANRKNERALEKEIQRRSELLKPQKTVIKMETPTKAADPCLHQQQQLSSSCKHPPPPSAAFSTNNGQPFVQNVFVPPSFYPPILPQYFQQPQQYQTYFGQPLSQQQQQPPPAMPQPESKPSTRTSSRSASWTSSRRSPTPSIKKPRKKSPKKSSKRKSSTKTKDLRKKSKKDVEKVSPKRRDSSTKITAETDVEFEISTPPTSTVSISIPSTPKTRSSSKGTDDELPCLSSDFEISKLENSPFEKKLLRKGFRKISESTTVTETETRTVTETLPSTSGSFYTSSIPTSRTVSRTTTAVIGDGNSKQQQQQNVKKIPKTWRKRKSLEIAPPPARETRLDNGMVSNDDEQTFSSLVSLASAAPQSPTVTTSTTPSTSQSSVFAETETDAENDDYGGRRRRAAPKYSKPSTTSVTSTSVTPVITEITTTASSPAAISTRTTPTTTVSSKTSTPTTPTPTPIITEPSEEDETTEKTQSPQKNNNCIQSPLSFSSGISSPSPPPPPLLKKERKQLGCRPKVAANVVQVLAKHREYDDSRLPNERFELIDAKEESPKMLSKLVSPPPPAMKKERKQLGCRPKVAANVIQVLAKHREYDDSRLPNERFEMADSKGGSPNMHTKLSSPSSTTMTKTPSTKSPPPSQLNMPQQYSDASAAAVPSQPFSSNILPPSTLPNSNRIFGNSNDPFLTYNPFWRSRSVQVTEIEKLQSPNSGRFNGVKVHSNETSIWLPMESAIENAGMNNNNNKLAPAPTPKTTAAELQKAQAIEIIKTDKTQESPP